jgi:phosphopantothenoylcysteine synthetase/decarboxylase
MPNVQPEPMRDDALSVIVCGSSAAVGVHAYLVWLRQEIDLSLRVLLTRSAERFIQPHTLSWYADELYTSDDPGLNPTEFAKRSLGIVVLPATANTIASAALGLAASPAQTVLLSADRPNLFFPSMNESMWRKPVVQRHVATLRDDGHTVVEPRRQPMFTLWDRQNTVGPAMPPMDEATEIIATWLETLVDEVASVSAVAGD